MKAPAAGAAAKAALSLALAGLAGEAQPTGN
jgi:hypothetical protein